MQIKMKQKQEVGQLQFNMPQCLFDLDPVRGSEVDGTGVSLADRAVKNF